jgi:hypothetical protein
MITKISHKMDQADILWILFFSFLLIASNAIYLTIRSSLGGKPMGFQSIYDQALVDNFLIGNLFGSWLCLIVIVSRLTWFRYLLANSETVLSSISAVTAFGRAAFCINGTCLSIIRIISVFNLSLLEETIGETRVQYITTLITILTSLITLFILYKNDELISGLMVTYTSDSHAISGESKKSNYF